MKASKIRNDGERVYAQSLDAKGVKWVHQPRKFSLGKTNYTPDFYLPETDTYVEVVGCVETWRVSRAKWATFQQLHPAVSFRMVDRTGKDWDPKAQPKDFTYLLRDLDDDSWRQFKTVAASEGKTMRAIILRLVTDYVQKCERRAA